MSHGELKTAPKGYPKDHPRIELLRYKGLVTWREWQPAPWLATKSTKGKLVHFFERSRPIADWLGKNVGPSGLGFSAGRGA